MQFDFYHPGRPIPKGRPRFTKRGGIYTPGNTRTAEADLLAQYIAQSGPLFKGGVGIDITFDYEGTSVSIWDEDWSSHLRGDLDNYVKLVLDALDKTAWNNDRQVVSVSARKV